ncbi:MAG: cytochrome c-type biogenesis protein CcmH/NrfG [Gammaproteobacteria bacterium]|jgi:cytochrome c-type biogenesis protein CcmH/NrfG
MRSTKIYQGWTLLFLLTITGCQSLFKSESIPYQTTDSAEPLPTSGAVTYLQQKAMQAGQTQRYDLAISHLQRAIKLEPRNPQNWYLMADNYAAKGEFESCRQFVLRSISYSKADSPLEPSNQSLWHQCLGEGNARSSY